MNMFGPDPIKEMNDQISMIKHGYKSTTTDPMTIKTDFMSLIVGLTSPNTPE